MRRNNPLTFLFLGESLRSVAVSFLSFFSAIFLYQEALALMKSQESALLTVFVFFLLLEVARVIGMYFAEKLSRRLGLRWQLNLGNFLTGLTILVFLFSGKHFNFLWLAAALWGLAIGFFWFGREGLVTKLGERDHYGKALGWGGVISSLLLVGVPFAGGLVIKFAGYQALFILSLLFIFLSFIPLVRVSPEKTHQHATLKEVFGLFYTHKRMFITYAGTGLTLTLYSTALILYLFLLLKKELALGSFFSLSMIIATVTNFFVGQWCDRRGKRTLLIYGGFFTALAWLSRIFLFETLGFFFADITERIAGGMIGIPLEILSYEKAVDGHSTGRAILFKELAISAGSISALVLLLLLVFCHLPFKLSFIAGAVAALSPLMIVHQFGEKNV